MKGHLHNGCSQLAVLKDFPRSFGLCSSLPSNLLPPLQHCLFALPPGQGSMPATCKYGGEFNMAVSRGKDQNGSLANRWQKKNPSLLQEEHLPCG